MVRVDFSILAPSSTKSGFVLGVQGAPRDSGGMPPPPVKILAPLGEAMHLAVAVAMAQW